MYWLIKVGILVFLFLMLLGGAYFYWNQSNNSHTESYYASREIQPEFICPEGMDEVLLKAGIKPKIPISCHPNPSSYAESEKFKVLDVMHDGHVFSSVTAPVLVYENKDFFVLPHEMLRRLELRKYVSLVSKTPFSGGWSNFKLRDFADMDVVKKDNIYCFMYTFKIPFKGIIEQCPNVRATADGTLPRTVIKGDVSYIEGEFEWDDAVALTRRECSKHYPGSFCKYGKAEWHNFYSYWGGPHANTAVKLSLDGKVHSYLFSEQYYDKGRVGMLFIQVFPDRTVRSVEVKRFSYRYEKLLEFSGTLFN